MRIWRTPKTSHDTPNHRRMRNAGLYAAVLRMSVKEFLPLSAPRRRHRGNKLTTPRSSPTMPTDMKSPSFLLRGFRSPREIAGFGLGKLEREVLEEVWRFDGEVSVRDVYRAFDERVAYTTLMTTLDRLFKKNLLNRRKDGRAFLYAAAIAR